MTYSAAVAMRSSQQFEKENAAILGGEYPLEAPSY
jgi:hypothetical protein